MHWPFRKKKKFDDRILKRQICNCIDRYLEKTFKSEVDVKERLLAIRNDVVETYIPEDPGNEILEILYRFKTQPIEPETMNLMAEEIEIIMFNLFKKKKLEKTQETAETKNKELIDELSFEIKECELRMASIDAEIQSALTSKQKTQWRLLSQERQTLIAKIDLKKKTLDSLILKQSNKEIDAETKRQQEITNHLQSSGNYVDTSSLADRVNESDATLDEIKDENAVVINAVNAGKTFDDDFDKAYEKYLLESAETSEEKKTNEVKGANR